MGIQRAFAVAPAKGLVICVAAVVICGCAYAQNSDSNPAPNKSKIETRNNAASLLADLLGNEKNVSKILIIKRNSAELGKLMKAISKTAGDGVKEIVEMAKNDSTLNLHELRLPPGEAAARAAILKTDEHELLSTSGGEKFELRLLLTQTNALDYGSHLAKVAAEYSSSTDQKRKFNALDTALNNLFRQVVSKLRALPGK